MQVAVIGHSMPHLLRVESTQGSIFVNILLPLTGHFDLGDLGFTLPCIADSDRDHFILLPFNSFLGLLPIEHRGLLGHDCLGVRA